MCGIAGYWNLRSGRPAEGAVASAMARSLAHRGPDEEGCWVDGSLALAAVRLRVVDPAGGRQPMPNEDGSVCAVFNGEIYNHGELRKQLEARGHRFRTRSDTEAIVHAFEEWGSRCVERFNGMFALAVWDGRQQRLLLARDRLGIKPLYVHDGPEGVVFGSELKAVVAAPWIDVAWDLEGLDDFLTYEYVPAPRTILQEVRKLAAGTVLLYDRARGSVPAAERFWRPVPAGPAPTTPEQASEELDDRLRTSVRRRLMADVPLGVFLSGGIDSSIVTGLVSAEIPEPVRSFSLGFSDRSYDELRYARRAAARFGTDHREELVTPRAVLLAERLADHFDEPFGDVSAFPTYLLSELARRDVTVALSGDGGDELFAGYDHYRAHRWASRLRWLAGSRPWAFVEGVLERVPPSPRKKGAVNLAKRFMEGCRRPADLEHARWWVFQDVDGRRSLYGPEVARRLEGRDCFEHYRGRMAEARQLGFEGLQRQLYADVTGYLADDILVKLDRMSMAVSLEARVPFLDHEVVEYAMGIPAGWKLHRGRGKWILRRAFTDLLPPEIRRRRKEGFSIPMKNWLRGPLRPMLLELLHERRVRERGWFRPAEVARLLREHLDGRENHAHRLWCLMSLELALEGLATRARSRFEHEVVAG
jgi:asparagine synthase (glutamine-hydrolysing)